LSLFADDEDMIINEMKCLNITDMTPLSALNLLSKWRDKLGKGKS